MNQINTRNNFYHTIYQVTYFQSLWFARLAALSDMVNQKERFQICGSQMQSPTFHCTLFQGSTTPYC